MSFGRHCGHPRLMRWAKVLSGPSSAVPSGRRNVPEMSVMTSKSSAACVELIAMTSRTGYDAHILTRCGPEPRSRCRRDSDVISCDTRQRTAQWLGYNGAWDRCTPRPPIPAAHSGGGMLGSLSGAGRRAGLRHQGRPEWLLLLGRIGRQIYHQEPAARRLGRRVLQP